MLAHEDPSTNAVPLRFNKKTLSTNGPPSSSSITLPSTTANNNTKASTSNGITPSSNPVNNLTSTLTNGKRKIDVVEPPKPAGVGFVDFSDDLDEIVTGEDNYEDGDDDDDLIDEDTLLDEDDLARPINQPPECRPKAGKRRRACKDCTCGLKEKIEAEDAAKREKADKALAAMKLAEDDLAEIDFTVPGKKFGNCGNCTLGDAFRCDGCPYLGLPAFKPGEEVRMLDDVVQL